MEGILIICLKLWESAAWIKISEKCNINMELSLDVK